MVVKAVRGRRRYIVFTVPAEANRASVMESLSSLSADLPDLRVISSFDGKAVIRCHPDEKEKVCSAMYGAYPGCESLITSGTLRKIREVYPELKVPKRKKG